MVKIKAIDQQYTMPEITAIVDELYPFGEYDLQEHKGTRKEVCTKEGKVIVHNGKVGVQVGGEFKEIKDGKFYTRDTKEKVTYNTIETNEAYCDKEDLMSLFFTLNKCNRKLAFSALPLTAREKRQLIEERAEAYKHLQAIITSEKPQPREEKQPLMQITAEAIDGLKHYFSAAFKGMGGNLNRFNENLIPALNRCQTRKEIANLIFACYKSDVMVRVHKPTSWNKWVEAVCRLLSIDGLPYKPGELERPDYDVKYYWLQPPKNRQ